MIDVHSEQNVWQSILDFWFDDIDRQKWFVKDNHFDELVRKKFAQCVHKALNHEYDHWNNDFSARLALILLLDQMTRNIFRNMPKAFSGDELALSLSFNAIHEGQLDIEPALSRRSFLLMPLMHSEDRDVQNDSIPFFEKYTDQNTVAYAHKHKDIIALFGRFPHRNALLGRQSTAEEIEFLQDPANIF